MASSQWRDRCAALWASHPGGDETQGDDALVTAMELLVDELDPADPLGPYERASAFDSTGDPDRAVPLYREALALGLQGRLRREATIQLASSLRNLGRHAESVALLQAETGRTHDDLDDAVLAFLALALLDAGHARAAVGTAVGALAAHIPRYRRSLTAYAAELAPPDQRRRTSDAEPAPRN